MIIIKLSKEKSLDSALKKFKYKFEKRGLKKDLLDRREYTKPSVQRRELIKKAIHRQKFNSQT